MTDETVFDPKGLMREAFLIEGIGPPECRSIFLDWALSVPAARDTSDEINKLIRHYTASAPSDHPMLATLTAALEDVGPPRRRGGRRGRIA